MGIAAFATALWRGEPDRWPLWLPVALGAGAAGYFALAAEPPLAAAWWALAAGTSLVLVAAWSLRGRVALALLAAVLLGFGLARLRTEQVATPVLDSPVIAHLTGRIVFLEPREKGVRYVLDAVRSGAFGAGAPLRLRIAQRSGGRDLRPGDWISVTAKLDAPPAPVEPGASDFGRSQYFQSIGGVGFAYGRAHSIVAARPPDLIQRIALGIEGLRADMTRRIQAGLPGSTGSIASALVTGTRGGITEEDEAALRDAGLAHVLAISGLQMAMVGGGIFWLLRAALAAVPVLALRWPIKKWAAGCALLVTTFYLVISGAAPSAARAFVMFAFVMLAVLLDRPALTMRSMALAAGSLLLLRPESVADPGFQMSFAAVVGLVAMAEWQQRRERAMPRGMVYRYVHAIVMTSLVGSMATLPFSLFHFERTAHYAILGNLIAMPVMGFWVMPAAALAVVLMPFGQEALALPLLGQGLAVMVAMGRWVSGLPGAVSLLPAIPVAALVAASLGGLWLAIWRETKRWLGLAPLAAAALIALLAPRPHMLVASDARTIAVRGDDGLLHFLRRPEDMFVAREWLRRDGDGRDPAGAVGMPGLSCDGLGCVLRRGVLIAASLRPEALAEDCARAGVLVSTVAVACRGPAVLIDGRAAAGGQGWRVTLSQTPTAVSVRQMRGMRPWVPATNTGE